MRNKINELADLLRTGKGTREIEAEYERLLKSRPRRTVKYRSVYELPIAERMWQSDARETEQ